MARTTRLMRLRSDLMLRTGCRTGLVNGSDDKPIQRAIDDAAYGDDSDSDLGGTDGDF
jgi:hypothetical protein